MNEKKHIIVVDDEELNLFLLEGILADEYLVTTVDSGASCLDKMNDIKPDIVLLDVEMPDMDGLETCKRIQEISECPVIFVSAKGSLQERLAGYAAGGYDYIVKPINGHELTAKLKLILSQESEKQSLKDNIESSYNTVMTALTSSSELGCILSFADKIHEAYNYKEVANLVLITMKQFGVETTLHIRGEIEKEYYSSNGICPPMEVEIMELLRHKGRIYDFSQRTQVNEKRISILVKNMPEDKEKYGRLKDHLPFILRIADGYIKNLDVSFKMLEQEKQLRKTVTQVNSQLVEVEKNLQQSNNMCFQAMNNLVDDFELRLEYLALSEEQENKLKEMVNSHTEKAVQTLENTDEINKTFSSILVKLRNLLE
ncbi:response regulator [Pseudoalteromonas denitrificans]|uniref:Response regulator receiver domain-containing protein n=1 Tax=Pseudoalteromonas denitrificans DSM 6059 TaxID=1123010 RepID=A0A1I1I8B5_9GAMM|nr:response regulator [Pseudoalteromonas denitrificans]SFC32416.1 Response regulator receiver domain-containing protein [Pseudoalteromonas denitrificans DSM 6059]